HTKSNDDDYSLSPSSNNSSSMNSCLNSKNHRQIKSISNQQYQNIDENEYSQDNIKRKRKLNSTTPNVNGKKIFIKVLPDKNHSEYESDLSNDESINSKRQRTSSKDYHLTLN
ncbi:unnamed protein product, partial [Rotaria sp. Silwood2]